MAAEVKSSSSARFLRRRAAARADKSKGGLRVLTASAAVLDVVDKAQVRRVKRMRQSWQEQAWNYVDDVGEVSFAHMFLANCTSRMKVFPAAYPTGKYDEDPVPISEIPDIPADVVAACNDAMNDLGSGRLACSAILESTSWQLSVAGEGFILGIDDPETGESSFSVRSIDEIIIADEKYKLREMPTSSTSGAEGEELNPDRTFLSRIWTPHPRWRLYARSSMRAVLDVCEELQILNRVMRSTGRSRAAQNGLLLVPDTISAAGQVEDDDDPESDPFLGRLTEAMVTGIADEGVASSVVPIVLRGPAAALEQLRHIILERPLDPAMAAGRTECLGRFASGMDLPKEVILGMTDLNHWTAWQVDSNTFSEHVEPHVVRCVDALTIGYFRAALMIDPRMSGANAEWLPRVCIWYDPNELLTNPNRVADATSAHSALVISDSAYRRELGFSDDDAPSAAELELRMVRSTRTYPPNVLEALLHLLDPTLEIPPQTKDGIPGMGPKGAVPVPVTGITAPTGGPSTGAPPTPSEPTAVPSTKPPGSDTAPDAAPGGNAPPAPILSSSKPKPNAEQVRLSRKLVDIDTDVRRSLQIAASASIRRQLEKAGAKLRTKAADAKDKTAMAVISGVPAERVAMAMGRDRVERFGGASLVRSDWSDVKSGFDAWVTSAQEQTLAVAQQLGGTRLSPTEVSKTRARFSESRVEAWKAMKASLDALAVRALTPPDEKVTPDPIEAAGKPTEAAPPGSTLAIPPEVQVGETTAADTAESLFVDPSTLMPMTTVRAILNIAGGASADDSALDTETGLVAEGAGPMGGIGTGEGLVDLLTEASMSTPGYQWIHGTGGKTDFEAHVDLDGTEFSSFDDDVLSTSGSDGWIGEYYTPGDHDGCTCDFMPMWAAQDVGDRPIDQVDTGDDAGDAEAETA